MVITYECSLLPRCNLHRWVFHELVNPLLEKICLLGASYDQDKGENVRKQVDGAMQLTNLTGIN